MVTVYAQLNVSSVSPPLFGVRFFLCFCFVLSFRNLSRLEDRCSIKSRPSSSFLEVRKASRRASLFFVECYWMIGSVFFFLLYAGCFLLATCSVPTPPLLESNSVSRYISVANSGIISCLFFVFVLLLYFLFSSLLLLPFQISPLLDTRSLPCLLAFCFSFFSTALLA